MPGLGSDEKSLATNKIIRVWLFDHRYKSGLKMWAEILTQPKLASSKDVDAAKIIHVADVPLAVMVRNLVGPDVEFVERGDKAAAVGIGHFQTPDLEELRRAGAEGCPTLTACLTTRADGFEAIYQDKVIEDGERRRVVVFVRNQEPLRDRENLRTFIETPIEDLASWINTGDAARLSAATRSILGAGTGEDLLATLAQLCQGYLAAVRLSNNVIVRGAQRRIGLVDTSGAGLSAWRLRTGESAVPIVQQSEWWSGPFARYRITGRIRQDLLQADVLSQFFSKGANQNESREAVLGLLQTCVGREDVTPTTASEADDLDLVVARAYVVLADRLKWP